MKYSWCLAAVVLVVSAACQSVATPPSESGGQADQPRKGGTLRIAAFREPTIWAIDAGGPNYESLKLLFDSLVVLDEKNVPQPSLATSWTPSDGGRVWTFKLRSDVKWHDGQPFSADDVKFTFDGVMDPKNRSGNLSLISTISKTEVVDPTTVRMTFKDPLSSLPSLLGFWSSILPKHVLQGQDLSKLPDVKLRTVGTGPFKLDEYVPGSFLSVVANEQYWGGRPYLDKVIVKIIQDRNVQLTQLLAGELDVADLVAEHVERVKASPNNDVLIVPQTWWQGMSINNQNLLFKDSRVRQAINYAVDREAIVKATTNGLGKVSNSPISPALGDYYKADVKPVYNFDQAKAKSLLADVGWRPGADGILVKDGTKFAFKCHFNKGVSSDEAKCVAVQQYLKTIGMDVTLDPLEANVLGARLLENPPTWGMGAARNAMPASADQRGFYTTGNLRNNNFYSNAQVDLVLQQAQGELDHAKQVALYHRFQELVAADPPSITLEDPFEIRGINKKLRGLPKIQRPDALEQIAKVYFAP